MNQSFMPPTTGDLASAGAKLDPQRLRNITATFSDPFKGLTFAAFGAAYATSQMLDLYWHGSHWSGLGVLLMASPFALWFFYLRKYYASRFGWVQQKQPPPLSSKELRLLGIVVGLLIVVWVLADLLQHLVPGPVNFLTLLQSAGFLCLILYLGFRGRARGYPMPVRVTIWAIVAAAQGIVAVLPLLVSLGPRQVLLCRLLNAGSAGILIMIMGLSDHVALVRMLPKRVEEG